MPAEAGSHFVRCGVRALHDILLPEQVGRIAQRGTTDVGHQVAEQEFAQFWLILEAIGQEVALVTMVDADRVRSGLVHAGVHYVDESLALASKQFEVVIGDDGFEDEITFLDELLSMAVGYDQMGKPIRL